MKLLQLPIYGQLLKCPTSMRCVMEKLGTQPTDFKVMDIVLFCIFGIVSFPCTAATTNCYVEEGKAYRGPPNQSFRNVESYESCRSLCSFGPDVPYFVWRGPNSPNPNSRLDCNCKMNRDTIEDVGGIYSGNTKCTNSKRHIVTCQQAVISRDVQILCL